MENLLFTPSKHRISWRNSLILAFLCLLNVSIRAQVITGKVRGSDGSALSQANILGISAAGKMLCYAISDDAGHFKLVVPDSLSHGKLQKIRVSYLGYATIEMPFGKLKDGETIVLPNDHHTIKEVTVRAQRIRNSGDTLTYSVAGFRQGQDRSIADVIAKMPGMEVGSDGTIKYQGTAINKFYIEGLDLMGARYGMANKNLSVDKVASVQVLQNHQPVKSLKGVVFSHQAALNLVLKDDAKAAWNGTVDLGIGMGHDLLYDNRLLGLNFSRKFQSLMMYKNNNTGRNIRSEVSDLITQGRNLTPQPGSLLSLMGITVPNMKEERYTFNQSHLLAGNWLWKLSKEETLRIQAHGLVDKSQVDKQRATTYLTLNGRPTVSEQEKITTKRSQWKGEANYQYNGKNTYISNNIQGNMNLDKSVGYIDLDGTDTRQMVRPHQFSVVDNLQLSHTTERKRVYKWDTQLAYYYYPGQLLTVRQQTEQTALHFFHANSAVNLGIPLGKHNVQQLVGVSYDNQSVRVSDGDTLAERRPYQYRSLYWEPKINFIMGSHRTSFTLRAQLVGQTYNHHHSRNLWADPLLSYRWEMTGLSTLTAYARIEHSPRALTDIFDIPIFIDYRSRLINRGQTGAIKTASLATTYQYANPIAGVFFSIQPSYIRRQGEVLYRENLNASIYDMMATDSTYTLVTQALNARISKSIGWAKTYIALHALLQRTNYTLLMAEQPHDARIDRSMLRLNYSLRPWQFMSLEGQTEMLSIRQKTISQQHQPQVTTTEWRHELGMFFYIGEKIMLSCKNQLLHTNDPALGTNWFVDMAASYRTNHSELTFTVSNIIGRNHIERIRLHDTFQTYTAYQLRPREVMLKWSFDL